jgi:hypothetical protein
LINGEGHCRSHALGFWGGKLLSPAFLLGLFRIQACTSYFVLPQAICVALALCSIKLTLAFQFPLPIGVSLDASEITRLVCPGLL